MSDGGPKAKKAQGGLGRPWGKGVSGNPGGLSHERREFLRSLRRSEEPHAKLVIEKLRTMALAGVEWAVRDYLDRLGVKMPDKMEVSGEDGAPLPGPVAPSAVDPSMMTSEQVRKRLEAIRAEREALLAAGKDDPGRGT